MTQVSVNDAPSTPHRQHRRRRKPRVLLLLSSAGIGLALAWFIVLPWLLRNRVQAALRSAGVGDVRFDIAEATPWGSTLTSVEAGDDVGIERLRIQYSPLDLWNGRLHALRVRGGRLELRVEDGRVDFGPLTSLLVGKDRPTTTTSSGDAGDRMTLPLERIELIESVLVLQTHRSAVQIPIDVMVDNRSRDELRITAHAGPSRNLRFEVAVNLAASQATFDGSADPGWTLLTVRSIWPVAAVAVDGQLQVSGDAHWGDKSAGGRLRLQAIESINNAGSDKLAQAQLRVTRGVLEVAGQLGPRGGLLINLSDASIAGEMYAASGVSAAMAFTALSPPATPPRQQLSVVELDIGGVKLAAGQVEFQVNSAGSIQIDQMSWNALGGRVSAADFVVQSGKPVAVTLHAEEIQLKDLLATFARDKASGEGTLSGELPIIIDGGNIAFGDGRAVALHRGRLQITDAAALAPAAESAAAAASSPSQSDQIKRNIVEALSDFEYDQLTARLDDEDGNGLSAYVRLSGRGRTGARQALDYDLRIRGLDGLIRSYLGVRRSMDYAQRSGKAEPK